MAAVRAAAFIKHWCSDSPDAPAMLAALERIQAAGSTESAAAAAPMLAHHVAVDPDAALNAGLRAEIAAARRAHVAMRINDELTTTITNSVHCTELIDMRTGEPYKLSLPMLQRSLARIGAQYTMQRFAKLVIRYGPSTHTTQLLFTSGKVLEPGKVAFGIKRKLLYALVDMLREAGLDTIGVGVRACQNLVSTGMLTFGVRLRLLQLKYSEGDHVTYDPNLFPGAVIRHPSLIDVLADVDSENDAGNMEEEGVADAAAAGDAAIYVYPGPRDCDTDEVLDNPEAERAATEYARALLARFGADANDTQRVDYIANEMLSAQAKKNIVALLFSVGCMIIGGVKNVRMLRRASALVYEMAVECRDTPQNRALELELLRAKGLPVSPDLLPASSAAAGGAKRGRKRGDTGNTAAAAVPPRKRAKTEPVS